MGSGVAISAWERPASRAEVGRAAEAELSEVRPVIRCFVEWAHRAGTLL
jgi:hypothetical protein